MCSSSSHEVFAHAGASGALCREARALAGARAVLTELGAPKSQFQQWSAPIAHLVIGR